MPERRAPRARSRGSDDSAGGELDRRGHAGERRVDSASCWRAASRPSRGGGADHSDTANADNSMEVERDPSVVSSIERKSAMHCEFGLRGGFMKHAVEFGLCGGRSVGESQVHEERGLRVQEPHQRSEAVVKTVMEAYADQMQRGRYLLHLQPWHTIIWSQSWVKRDARSRGV